MTTSEDHIIDTHVFIGGPLDGQRRIVDESHLTVAKYVSLENDLSTSPAAVKGVVHRVNYIPFLLKADEDTLYLYWAREGTPVKDHLALLFNRYRRDK